MSNTIMPIKPVGLLQGLTYSYPIEGVIRAGTTVERERNGRRINLPKKLDEFILTTKHKGADGEWVRHPLDETLRAAYGVDDGQGGRKLRRLPVTLAFDRPELSLSEQYAAFTNEGRPLCVGDGRDARRRVLGDDGYTVEACACPGAGNCDFGETNRCDTFLRLMVRLEGQHEMDGLFILRTGSINGVTDTRAFIEHLARTLGGRIAGVPLWLTLEAKQSAMSRQSVFWHASFRPRFESLLQAAQQLNDARAQEAALDIDRAAGERVLLDLRGNGAFADGAEEDGAQFDDLIAARFMDSDDDGQGGTTEVRARRRKTTASPTQAAQAAVRQLNVLLGGERAAAPAAPAAVATEPVAASTGAGLSATLPVHALPVLTSLDGKAATPAPVATALPEATS